ncbi:SCO1664 family protein [Gordonia sp. TBRC 11910]|uniref:SCO1664 family protein n=1 Tax=Gordonia asplenii TaxID=2725283 RepID=A0A848KR39_9ACTN|nr:SCO1664 family protein [Gordonia asplenii]NMO00397.1 SCO1664 family protein [Gordonia asplenii]
MADVETILRDGDIEILGRVPHASNATLVCEARLGDGEPVRCVYKPIRGEAPLWDFPDGTLADREVASYEISQALGWGLIPETVLRVEAPLGPGMVQRWIDLPDDEPDVDVVDLVPVDAVPPGVKVILRAYDAADRPVVLVHQSADRLRQLAVLDVIINNADRKGGHILRTDDGRLYGIDHGICLHADDKLRTVLWGWAGEQIPATLLADVERLAARLRDVGDPLRAQLAAHLTAVELDALAARCAVLAAGAIMPVPPPHRPIPWPPF